MPFIVTEPCINCNHTPCVDVFPMDCFVEGPNFLAIDADTCIDFSIWVSQCPVGAIVNAAEADERQRPWIELNARLARDPRWTPITRSKPSLGGHDEWSRFGDKRRDLEFPS